MVGHSQNIRLRPLRLNSKLIYLQHVWLTLIIRSLLMLAIVLFVMISVLQIKRIIISLLFTWTEYRFPGEKGQLLLLEIIMLLYSVV